MLQQYSSNAKVILLGEHSVLRGKSAIVLPVNKFSISLTIGSAANFKVVVAKHFDKRLVAVTQRLINKSLHLLKHVVTEPCFNFYIDGNFPIGQGLGFSAALCSVIASWSIDYTKSSETTVIKLAKILEQDFHGHSSGIDVIGVNSDKIKLFYNIDKVQDITPIWSPNLYLSLFDYYKPTIDCVDKVEKIDTNKLRLIDNTMQRAVNMSLQSFTENNATNLLSQAIKLGCNCFSSWGLIDKWQQQEIDMLYEKGAIAVKPTGAGGGGLISLWDTKPPYDDLINCILQYN